MSIDCEICRRRPRGICAKHKRHLEKIMELKQMRKEVLELLGGKCSCCNESHKEFLRIMIRGHSDRGKVRGKPFYRKILKDFGSMRYTLKCYNCSMAIFHNRVCPHQKEKEE